ncbi:MAG TPA: 5-amino-6-(5-phospho-D-ribitylamino)uracil phosphatase YigB [Vibrio sp.]|uniref:5-amino-6-(5-phospho-D-ribitylamino)uracil phosphatase YigB n=1 Tax=Vibrio TaxID=662 RepID=UPI000EEA73C2|nr:MULTISPECIES: 5-amino-6-(5-phospho-D-ribitylamino)uracil phosphatase YigB [Vibrio]HCH00933.1 5-amino-6-(5-phospho-D-ribitylamino)uracil phosphatase YigB [Vibrio sp.]
MSLRFYRNIPTIKAMTFDLDDTLYDNHPVIVGLEQKTADWMHQHHPISQNMSHQEWRLLKFKLAEQTPFLESDVSEWRFQQIRQGLIHLGYDDPKASQAAKSAMDQVVIWRHQIEVPPMTHHVMAQLKQQMPLIAITNGNVNPDKIGLGEYFDLVLNAGPDGWAKPHSQMFETALAHLGLPAEHVLHVGDNLISDVAGAKYVGMQACWINDYHKSLKHEDYGRVLPDVEITALEDLLVFIESRC